METTRAGSRIVAGEHAVGLTLLLLLCGATVAWPQSPKVIGGVGFGSYGTDWGMTSDRLRGPVVGAGIEIGRGALAGEIDALFVQKRDRYVSRGWDFTLDELSLPVLLKARVGSRVRPYVAGGGEIALILSQHTAEAHGGRAMNDLPTVTWDYGLVVGAGVEVPAGPLTLGLEGRYHHGLRNTTRFTSDGYDFKTRVIAIVAAVRL